MAGKHDISPKQALLEAVARAGSQQALADGVGCSQPNIHKMIKRGACSPRYALSIEAMTGVSRHDLCPNIYPKES